MAYPFLPFCGISFPGSNPCLAVCQKQIAVPNNSLLYCSEKCKREDSLSSSPSSSHRSFSSANLAEFRQSPNAMSFEPSRKEQWGIPPSPTRETPPMPIQGHSVPGYFGTSPTTRPSIHRSGSSRPLPPLHPRALGSSPRSVDLVLPVYREEHGPAPMETERKSFERKSLDYGRRIVESGPTNTGGLKRMFHFKELQMSPAS